MNTAPPRPPRLPVNVQLVKMGFDPPLQLSAPPLVARLPAKTQFVATGLAPRQFKELPAAKEPFPMNWLLRIVALLLQQKMPEPDPPTLSRNRQLVIVAWLWSSRRIAPPRIWTELSVKMQLSIVGLLEFVQ